MTKDQQLLEALYGMITPSKIEMFDRLAALRTNYITIALENVHQEHNASAVMRTCDCFGIQNLHVIERDNKYKVQRDIARGAGRWMNTFNYTSNRPTEDCIERLRKEGYRIIATTPHENDVSIYDLPLDQPTALIFGTEGDGISQEVMDAADGFVKIPMYGFTESFNISVSVALSLSILRKRLEESSFDWLLDEAEQIKQKIAWSERIIPHGNQVVPEVKRRLFEKK